jgi:hypothetical protein
MFYAPVFFITRNTLFNIFRTENIAIKLKRIVRISCKKGIWTGISWLRIDPVGRLLET